MSHRLSRGVFCLFAIIVSALHISCTGPDAASDVQLNAEQIDVIQQFHAAAGTIDRDSLKSLSSGKAAKLLSKSESDRSITDIFIAFGAARLEIVSAKKQGGEIRIGITLTPDNQSTQEHQIIMEMTDGRPQITDFSAPLPVSTFEIVVDVDCNAAIVENMEANLSRARQILRDHEVGITDYLLLPVPTVSDPGHAEDSITYGSVRLRFTFEKASAIDQAMEILSGSLRSGDLDPSLTIEKSHAASLDLICSSEAIATFRTALLDQQRTVIIERMKNMGASGTEFSASGRDHPTMLTFRSVFPKGTDIRGRLVWLCTRAQIGFHFAWVGRDGETIRGDSQAAVMQAVGGKLPSATFLASTKGSAGVPPTWYVLNREPIITGAQIKSAQAANDNTRDQPQLALSFTEQGAAILDRVTREAIGKTIALVFDGTILLAATLQGKLSNDVVISGNFTRQELEDIVRPLSMPALPAPMRVISCDESGQGGAG